MYYFSLVTIITRSQDYILLLKKLKCDSKVDTLPTVQGIADFFKSVSAQEKERTIKILPPDHLLIKGTIRKFKS